MTNRKDLIGGIFVVAVGLFFAVGAWLHLRMGTALRMGPGYFPFTVGWLVVVLGLAITASAFRQPDRRFETIPWRAIVLVSLAPLIFGALVRGAGLVPAMAISAFAAAFASRKMTLPMAAALAAALTVFSVTVFLFALGLPLRALGPWLGG